MNERIAEALEALCAEVRALREELSYNATLARDGMMERSAAARYLGIAEETLRDRSAAGEVACYKHGRATYYRRSELDKMIEAGRRSTDEEVQAVAARYLKEMRAQKKR